MSEPKLTKAARRALEIIALEPAGLTGAAFARKAWVDTLPEDRRRCMSSSRFHGYRRRGGSYLESLRRIGLLETLETGHCAPTYRVSQLGQRLLARGK